jgi:hypothetical protein
MGHGHTPQIMMELTQAEAAEVFPDWQNSDPEAKPRYPVVGLPYCQLPWTLSLR